MHVTLSTIIFFVVIFCATLLLLQQPSYALRIAGIGDYGRAGPETGEKIVADMVHSWNPDLVITFGDNNYPNGAAETIDQNVGQFYHWAMYPYNGSFGLGASDKVNKFFPSPGNHDWRQPDLKPYLDYLGPLIPASTSGNKRYYDFVKGPIHFFSLDSDHKEPDGITQDSKQAKWFKSRLEASTSKYRVVYFHHMPYANDAWDKASPKLRWPFRDWGATVVSSGHAHQYNKVVVDSFTYIVCGCSGTVPLYPFAKEAPIPGTLALYNKTFGALRIDADDTAMTFNFFSVDGSYFDRTVFLPVEVQTTNVQTTQQQNNQQQAATSSQLGAGIGIGIGIGIVVVAAGILVKTKLLGGGSRGDDGVSKRTFSVTPTSTMMEYHEDGSTM